MKTINFTNQPDFEIIEAAGIILTCDENMNFIISDEDYGRLMYEFPASFGDCYIVEEEKKFSLVAGNENSIFVWSSPFAKNFSEMPEVNDDMTVIICNAHNPHITIYDTKKFSEEEILEVVKAHCALVTSGCNYRYELIKKIGNCYFVN